MSYSAPSTPRAYQTTATMTASQPQLIVMLYDGAHRFLAQAAVAMRANNIAAAHNKLRRAEMIVTHLNQSLDFERGGDIAPRLASLYAFSLRHLNAARVTRDADKIDEVDRILGTVREAWAQLAAQ